MKAVILAAGKSTRTQPLTSTRPKPLLKVANKTIIEHNLDQLQGLVSEAIIVIGYLGSQIKKLLGTKYKKIKITYVEQQEQLGTGHALLQVKNTVKGKFLVLNGDDIFFRRDIKKCLKRPASILTYHLDAIHDFGAIETTGKFLKKILEKSDRLDLHLVNTGLYVLTKDIFSLKIKKSRRGEIEITDMINALAKQKKIAIVTAAHWFPITYPWNLLKANEYLLGDIKRKIQGEVGKGVTIKGPVIIGKGTVVKAHTHIEGPAIIGENCIIGPHAYIRPDTTIGDNCRIRAEIVDSIIMDNTTAKHHSYIGHSVIGENVNIAAGTVTADYRHDAKEHITIIKGKKVDTQRKKLGAFIGDKVMTGINTTIYPGRKIWPGKTTLPGGIVSKDIT